MGKLWAITQREYLERVRTRWFIFTTVFGPLLFGSLIFLPPYFASRSTASADVSQIIILDATGTGVGRRIAIDLAGGIMGDTSLARVRELEPSRLAAAERAAVADVVRQSVKGYLVLDQNTLTSAEVRYGGTNTTSASDMQRVRRAVQQGILAVRMERAGVDPREAPALSRLRVQLDAQSVTERGRGGSGLSVFLFATAVAVLLYTSIFFYGQNVLRGVLEEKQSRVAEVVMSSVPARYLLAGKVFGVGAVGLTQLAIWLTTSLLLMRARAPLLARLGADVGMFRLPSISLGNAATLLLFFLLGYTLYASLLAAVGAMVNTEQEAQQAQMPVALLLVASVLFLQPVITNPGGKLATALSLIPFTAPVVMPLRMSVMAVSASEIVGSLALIALACHVSIRAAARIYRVGLLMYGKRPTLRELARWIRYPG